MSKTREALSKLNEKQIKYCKTMSAVIATDRKNWNHFQYERDCGKLRGFLECLTQMNVINVNEMKALYLWFSTEDRNKTKSKEN